MVLASYVALVGWVLASSIRWWSACVLMRWTVRRGVGVERRLDGLVVELQHSLFANSHWSSCRRATFSLDQCSSIGKAAGARINTSNAIHGGGNIIRRVVHNSLLTNPHSNTRSLPTRIGQAADAQLAPSTNAQALVKLRARVSIPRMPSAVVVTSSDAW